MIFGRFSADQAKTMPKTLKLIWFDGFFRPNRCHRVDASNKRQPSIKWML